MKTAVAALALIAVVAPARADDRTDAASQSAPGELEAYVQCAPYAREVSGIEIYGDARSWWEQAQGRYATGTRPQVGAIMTFRPSRGMQAGHVATVSRVLDSRRVLLDHANWSPIDGRRGRIEKDVPALDVSPNNDWSAVRVWYAPLDDLGTTPWPVEGFIYGDGARNPGTRVAQGPTRRESSKRFASAFADFAK